MTTLFDKFWIPFAYDDGGAGGGPAATKGNFAIAFSAALRAAAARIASPNSDDYAKACNDCADIINGMADEVEQGNDNNAQ